MQEKKVVIKNPSGLHARPASLLVQTAGKFQSDVQIEKNGKAVNAKSILGVMSLAVANGEELTVRTNGKDEADALAAIVSLIEGGLGE